MAWVAMANMPGWDLLFRGASWVCAASMAAFAIDLALTRQAVSASLCTALAMLWLLGIALPERRELRLPAALVMAFGAAVTVAMAGYLSLSNRPALQLLGIAFGIAACTALVALFQARRQRAGN